MIDGLHSSRYVLSNSLTQVVVPASGGDSKQMQTAPPPFIGMGTGLKLMGGSQWNTSLVVTSFNSVIEAQGPVFVRVVLYYVFSDKGSFDISFTLGSSDSFTIIDET